MIIGIVGHGRAGKDWLAEQMIEYTNKNCQRKLRRFALADLLKKLMSLSNGISVEELEARKPEFRQRMIDFSEQGIKLVSKTFWVEYFSVVKKKEGLLNWVITDVRYWEEYDYLLEKYPNKVVFVYVTRTDGTEVVKNCGCKIGPDACHIEYLNHEGFGKGNMVYRTCETLVSTKKLVIGDRILINSKQP